MKRRIGSMVLLLAIGLVACRHAPPPIPAGAANSPAAGESQPLTPPSTKEILKLLLANCDVSLKVDASCAGVGSDFSDATIGDYISGLLAQQAQRRGENWIEVTCEPQPLTPPTQYWKCRVVFQRIAAEERGGWGVTFLVRASTRSVVRDSFRCTGSG
jgi:hypothetical protein